MTLRSNSTLHLAFSAALTARHPAIKRHRLVPFHTCLGISPEPPVRRCSVYSGAERADGHLSFLSSVARARLPQVVMTFLNQLTFTRKKSTQSAASDWLQQKSSLADKVVGPGMQHSSSRMPMPWATPPRTLNNSKDMGVSV